MSDDTTNCLYTYGETFGVRESRDGWEVVDLRTGRVAARRPALTSAISAASRWAAIELDMQGDIYTGALGR